MVVHTYKPSAGEDEAGGTQVQGQYELHSKIVSQKKSMFPYLYKNPGHAFMKDRQ